MHLSDGALTLAALGEPTTAAEALHLQACPDCRQRRDQLAEVKRLALSPELDDAPTPKLVRRRQARPWLLIAAGFAGLLAGAGLLASVEAWNSTPDVVASSTLTPVPGGPQLGQIGTARLEKVADGEVLNVTTTGMPAASGYFEAWLLDPSTGGMISIGALSAPNSQVVLPLPNGVDLARYGTVDISDEPFDDNPGHSSVSLLRGQLKA